VPIRINTADAPAMNLAHSWHPFAPSQTNHLIETSAMKKRSIQLRHPDASARILSGIAFVSVCILVGLAVLFADAHAQVATPATPSPTATPFPPFVPGRTPPNPLDGSAFPKNVSLLAWPFSFMVSANIQLKRLGMRRNDTQCF
jgi:hypothetical protein